MSLRVITRGHVVRHRVPVVGERVPKARWVVHRETCQFAPGCTPLRDLCDTEGQQWVLARLRAKVIARCVSCRPIVVERVTDSGSAQR